MYLITILLLMVIVAVHVTASEKTILILPFTNTGSIEYDNLRDLIPNYFYALFKDIEGYSSVSPFKIKQYNDGYFYKIKNFEKESLMPFVENYNARFIIRGEFRDYDGDLIVYLVIISTVDWHLEPRILKGKIRIPIAYTLNELFQPVIKDVTGYILESSVLSITTDHPCNLFIDQDYFGETPMHIRLLKGEHTIEIKYRQGEKEESIYKGSVTLKASVDESIDITVFVPLTIKAEKECTVFVNGEKEGGTPLIKRLYTGREYHVRVVYTEPKKGDIIAYEKVISTEENTFMEDPEIELSLPAKAGILVSESRYDLLCSCNNGEPQTLPHAFSNLEPGNYTLEVFLPDSLWNRQWILYKRKHTVYAYEQVSVNLKDDRYQKQFLYCLIPSAAQFHNHEPVKGMTILSLFSGSLLLSGISAIAGYLYHMEYLDVKHAFETHGFESGYTQRDVDVAYMPVATCNMLITAGFIGSIIMYMYSAIDGTITMDHLDHVLNAPAYTE
jgi:hypothetical protein